VNLFQSLAIPLLLVIIVAEWVRVLRHGLPWAGPLFRTIIWLAATGFILFPDSLTHLANTLGIGRGADILLYGLTLAFLFMSFLLYARIVQLRRQMTQIVRHLALTQPLPPTGKTGPIA
jgi:small membrane protein